METPEKSKGYWDFTQNGHPTNKNAYQNVVKKL